MTYEIIIKSLLEEFPRFANYISDEEYLLDLPHCIFDMFFVSYVEELCKQKQENELKVVGTFLEKMATCNDVRVKELMNVSFLEPFTLGNERTSIIELKKYLQKETMKEYLFWINKNIVDHEIS